MQVIAYLDTGKISTGPHSMHRAKLSMLRSLAHLEDQSRVRLDTFRICVHALPSSTSYHDASFFNTCCADRLPVTSSL